MSDFLKTGSATYRSFYKDYLRVEPRCIPKSSGDTWPELAAGSSLDRVLKAGVLRFAWIDNPPYVIASGVAGQPPTGIDAELGAELVTRIAKHYQAALKPAWVQLAGSSPSVEQLFDDLYAGLGQEPTTCDAALSGQLNMGDLTPKDKPVAWTCAFELIFVNIIYTGRDGLSVASLTNGTREQFIDWVGKSGRNLFFFTASNPGPSSSTALTLLSDMYDRIETVWLQGSTSGDKVNEAFDQKKVHFLVGDSIASSWMCLRSPQSVNLDIMAYKIDDPCSVAMQVSAFTLPDPAD